jgi:hypothetical protein
MMILLIKFLVGYM